MKEKIQKFVNEHKTITVLIGATIGAVIGVVFGLGSEDEFEYEEILDLEDNPEPES